MSAGPIAILVVAMVWLQPACKQDAAAPAQVVDESGARAVHEAHHVVEPPPRPRPAALTHVTIKALGMYCEESCPLKVRAALASVPAVYELGFDVSTESIFVAYDAELGAAKQVTAPMLVAIRAAGFDPWLANESWPEGADVQVVR